MAQFVEALVVGGAENLAVRIANGRAATGLPSLVYSLQADGPLRGRVSPDVPLRELGVERESIKRPFPFIASLRRGRRILLDQLRRDGVDVVQAHLPEANLWSLVLTGPHAPPVIPTIHNNNEFYLSDRRSGLRQAMRRRAYRLVLERCPVAVAVSSAVRDHLIVDLRLNTKQADKLVAVPNGVDVPDLDATIRPAVRAEFGLLPDEALILGAGRLTAQKNFSALIEVAAALRERGVSALVAIAGEGEERSLLEERIAKLGLAGRVRLLGVRHDLDRLLQAADMFVLSSLWEGLPLVVLEAMAAACPVAAYAIDGTRELIGDDRNGVLAPAGDSMILADRVASCLGNSEFRHQVARNGRQLVESRYSFQSVLDQLELVYSMGCERSSKGDVAS